MTSCLLYLLETFILTLMQLNIEVGKEKIYNKNRVSRHRQIRELFSSESKCLKPNI